MRRRNIRKPHRIKKKKTIFHYRSFWLTLLLILIVTGLAYFVCFSSVFQVYNINIEKEEVIMSPGIHAISDKVVKDIGLLTEEGIRRVIAWKETKSILLVYGRIIERAILDQFPEIAEVEFKKEFLNNSLTVFLTRRRGVAVWCQADNCFLVDENGVVFSDVSEIDKELLRIVNLDYQEGFKLGQEVVTKENLSLFLELASKIKNVEGLDVSIQELELVSEERVNVVTTEGWRIFVNPQKEVDWQLTKLEVDLKEEIPYEKRKDLEYIELRFNNFAPYKYQEENQSM